MFPEMKICNQTQDLESRAGSIREGGWLAGLCGVIKRSIWFLFQVPGTEQQKPLEFPEREKCLFLNSS